MKPINPFTEAEAIPLKKHGAVYKGRSAGKEFIGRAFKGKTDAERTSIIQRSMQTMRDKAATRPARREVLRKKLKR